MKDQPKEPKRGKVVKDQDDPALAIKRSRQAEYSGRNTLVLCFDGTGNKFTGDGGDSNIIKIFSMLDREDKNQFVYYQPGIGTYVQSNTYTHTGTIAKVRSWYKKAKDSAIGTSFEQHVMGGYKFLMRYYNPGDDLYFFGFSRGAYTARFLAQMLDYVGLLAAGNEELLRFAWKTFSKWQTRKDDTDQDKEEKKKIYTFMKKFRSTFSIPVKRIRFLGLFDTVNSVPRFENKLLQRTKFPYTARTSALVIRHAVSIDERRAKFRQDLISQKRPKEADGEHHHHHHPHHLTGKRHSSTRSTGSNSFLHPGLKRAPTEKMDRFEPRRRRPSAMALSPVSEPPISDAASGISRSAESIDSQTLIQDRTEEAKVDDDDEEKAPQDIQEVWFPGCHADIGGGWPLTEGESISLAYAPLIWMIREARKAGLPFDEDALKEAEWIYDEATEEATFHDAREVQQPGQSRVDLPTLEIDGVVMADEPSSSVPAGPEQKIDTVYRDSFYDKLTTAATKGFKHDVLEFGNGTPAGGVISWNFMEWLPFRRMDLRPDGSWKAIRWPLPRGETRDIPADAWIHISALQRMEADPYYRPGNLIIGGGGRGVKTAPASVGIGKWDTFREGDLVDKILVRGSEAGNIKALERHQTEKMGEKNGNA